MKKVCAWCGVELPSTNSDGTERISHGICVPCIDRHFPEIAMKVKERLILKEAA